MTRLGDVKACKRSGTPLFKWGATIVSEQRRSPDFVTRSPQSRTCTPRRAHARDQGGEARFRRDQQTTIFWTPWPYLGGQVCNHSTRCPHAEVGFYDGARTGPNSVVLRMFTMSQLH